MTAPLHHARLPGADAPQMAPCVLAVGAWLKNTACLLKGREVSWSDAHGDLGTAEACLAMEASVEALVAHADGRIDAVAHDLHPDFESTRLALAWADWLGVPAVAVQHHHAHIAVVAAEADLAGPVVGLALDGVGLGTDGTAWGGEVLVVDGDRMQRLAHLPTLVLPGGDAAAREPWRMGAAVLQAMGQADQIGLRFAPVVGSRTAQMMQAVLARGVNCPPTTSAGRWFDAIAALLGLGVRQAAEAEAAQALERAAAEWLETHAPARPALRRSDGETRPVPTAGAEVIDLLPLVGTVMTIGRRHQPDAVGAAAALFHAGLADALVEAAARACADVGTTTVVLGGGCFFNRVLSRRVQDGLAAAGLAVRRPQTVSCGDAGLALGQAWVAASALLRNPRADRDGGLAAVARPRTNDHEETPACA